MLCRIVLLWPFQIQYLLVVFDSARYELVILRGGAFCELTDLRGGAFCDLAFGELAFGESTHNRLKHTLLLYSEGNSEQSTFSGSRDTNYPRF